MSHDDEDLEEMWGTVTEITPYGLQVRLDGGGDTLVPKFWSKMWGHDPGTMRVGSRVRCAVKVEWKPSYFVEAVLTVVHDGGKQGEAD